MDKKEDSTVKIAHRGIVKTEDMYRVFVAPAEAFRTGMTGIAEDDEHKKHHDSTFNISQAHVNSSIITTRAKRRT